MRDEIRRIQKHLGITTIYVTHDQEEAMAVSDRIAILCRGRVEQVGTPAGIYFRPASRFSAEFMGGSNILELAVVGYNEQIAMITAEADGQRVLRYGRPARRPIDPPLGAAGVDSRRRSARAGDQNLLSGTIVSSSFLGSMVRYRVTGPGGQVLTIEVHDPEETGIQPTATPSFIRSRRTGRSFCPGEGAAVTNYFQSWNIILALIFVVLFFAVVYPILSIFKASFIDPETGAFSLKSYDAFFHYPFYLRCLGNSLFVSTLATLLSLVIGIPFAFFLSRYQIPGQTLLKTLGTLPLILPTFIGAEAWLMLLGRNGLFAKVLQQIGLEIPTIYGWKGIVLVFTLQFFPFVFLMVSAAINAIDRSLEESATNLGAGRLRVFFTVTLPVITPAILAGALVVFYLCIENFGVPTLIGEDFRVLSVQAYNEFISEMGGNPSMAGALSMILLAITLALTVFQKYWVGRKSYAMTSLNPLEVKRSGRCRTFMLDLLCRCGLRGPVPLCGRHRLLGNQEPGAGHVFRTMEPGKFYPGLHDRPAADLQLLFPGDDGHRSSGFSSASW